jgi:hypothetical protein
MASRAFFEAIRTLGFASISGTYASVGAAATHEIIAFCISNNTAGDLYFTTNTGQNEMFLAAGSFRLYDVQTNIGPKDDKKVFRVGTQFSVKQITAPVSGDVYIELIY